MDFYSFVGNKKGNDIPIKKKGKRKKGKDIGLYLTERAKSGPLDLFSTMAQLIHE